MTVADGNDLAAIDAALQAARAETERPSLILVRTHIGYGSPNKQDSFEAHGSPLGVDEVRLTKQNLGWPTEPPFLIPDAALAHFREALDARRARRSGVERAHGAPTRRRFPSWRASCSAGLRGELPPGWDADIPSLRRRRQGHGHARRLGQGDERHRAAAAGADRRLGRPRSVDVHGAEGTRRLQSAGRRSDDDTQGSDRRRLELRRTQPALRRARARDGRDRQRPGRAWRHHAVRRDLPDLLRLHAPADPAGRADGTARRATCSPTTASRSARTARRTSRSSSWPSLRAIPEPDRDPARRRQRDRGRLARRARDARSPGRAGADAARTCRRSIAAATPRPTACAAAPTCWPMRRTASPS